MRQTLSASNREFAPRCQDAKSAKNTKEICISCQLLASWRLGGNRRRSASSLRIRLQAFSSRLQVIDSNVDVLRCYNLLCDLLLY